ncbi:hypothetical protein [Allostreptomyces psammosilenae]|uniref:Uncharacterized protein n=1 Tax=Allostreptomyces psammosilenae TaxID=1892865 RepID=A0A853A0A0_9ACTN|nr:hypothetical protein [Allostreptomyces psammosilenae]NYI08006.1 hypothetical protein [Allostreptomyces psammosilenae]
MATETVETAAPETAAPETATPAEEAHRSDAPDVTFRVPEGFFSLPLEGTEDERAEALVRLADQLLPGGDVYQRALTLAHMATAAEQESAVGTLYSGFALLRTEADEVALMTLRAAVARMRNPAPSVAVSLIADALETERPVRTVQIVDLPCGPAVVSMELLGYELRQDVEVPEELVAPAPERDPEDVPEDGPGDGRFWLGVAEVRVPFPSGDKVLVLSMSTPTLPEYGEFVTKLAEIAETISFTGRDYIDDIEDGVTPAAPPAPAAPAESPATSRLLNRMRGLG